MNPTTFFSKKFFKLNQAIVEVVDNFSLVQFTQMDIQDEDCVNGVIALIDSLVQFDEFRMPNDKNFLDNREE